MNEKFRQELDIQLSDVKWTDEDAREVMKQTKRNKRYSVRMTVVMAAMLAVLLALTGIGYAEYHSGILSELFGGRMVRKEAEDLLVFEPVTLTKDGITVTITEYLYDGQSMYMAGEMRNDTDRALLCGMKDLHGGGGSGVFDLKTGLVMVQPGETATGQVKISGMNTLQEILNQWQVKVQAVALRPTGEVRPDVNDTEYYAVHNHYGTDLTETVFDETLSFPMITNQTARPSRTVPGEQNFRMEEYGYTLAVSKANFAAASSEVRFEVIPDDLKDIQSYGDEGAEGHERLYRWYEILDENGERLFKGLTGGATFGRNEQKTRITYAYEFGPLENVPESIVLVPRDEDGNYLMNEAVTVPIMPR